MKEINYQAQHLLMFKAHAERELDLLIASKEALSIESELRHEMMLLHYDFGLKFFFGTYFSQARITPSMHFAVMWKN